MNTSLDRDLAVVRALIHEDSPEGESARAALGLRWAVGSSAAYPAKRLVSDYIPTTIEERDALRKEDR